jgi:Xaa-Pro aminopeptidase
MNTVSNSNNNEKMDEIRTHDIPIEDAMSEFMKQGWAPSPLSGVIPHPSIPYTKLRREKLSKKYPGVRLVFPAGSLKVRSNDSDYPFRAHSAFSWFTGIIAPDSVPDSVFVMEPNIECHEDLLFIHSRSTRENDEFYKNARYGEFWVGRRMSTDETEIKYELKIRQIESIEQFFADKKETLIIRGEDKKIDTLVTESEDKEKEFLNFTSLMRLVKDQYEINEMQKAVDASVRGFDDIVRVFPAATSVPRGERVIESAFYGRARLEGNEPGYSSIVAAGSHACVLHWIKNDGDVLPGDLVLIEQSCTSIPK